TAARGTGSTFSSATRRSAPGPPRCRRTSSPTGRSSFPDAEEPRMKLRVVGAGLGRTGTHSLKLALEQLLGGPCYHMVEVFGHPEHVPLWRDAARGNEPDWDALFADYVATVDW